MFIVYNILQKRSFFKEKIWNIQVCKCGNCVAHRIQRHTESVLLSFIVMYNVGLGICYGIPQRLYLSYKVQGVLCGAGVYLTLYGRESER